MTILKTQKFDTLNLLKVEITIGIKSNGECFCEIASMAPSGLEITEHKIITCKLEKINYMTSRGIYVIYLKKSNDLKSLLFTKRKNEKIVERHFWKISDYMEETK